MSVLTVMVMFNLVAMAVVMVVMVNREWVKGFEFTYSVSVSVLRLGLWVRCGNGDDDGDTMRKHKCKQDGDQNLHRSHWPL